MVVWTWPTEYSLPTPRIGQRGEMAAHQCHLAHSHVLLGPNCVLKIENKKKKEHFTKKIQIP